MGDRVVSASPTITDDSTRVIRDRRFSLDDGDSSILAALAHLRREHVTGQLIIDLACGGANGLRFREEKKIDFDGK